MEEVLQGVSRPAGCCRAFGDSRVRSAGMANGDAKKLLDLHGVRCGAVFSSVTWKRGLLTSSFHWLGCQLAIGILAASLGPAHVGDDLVAKAALDNGDEVEMGQRMAGPNGQEMLRAVGGGDLHPTGAQTLQLGSLAVPKDATVLLGHAGDLDTNVAGIASSKHITPIQQLKGGAVLAAPA